VTLPASGLIVKVVFTANNGREKFHIKIARTIKSMFAQTPVAAFGCAVSHSPTQDRVETGFQKMRGKRMPQSVARRRLVQPGQLHCRLCHPLDACFVQMIPFEQSIHRAERNLRPMPEPWVNQC